MVVCVKMMLKGSKEALTVFIVTHVTHVERVKSGVCGLCTQYRYIQCYVKRVKRSLNSFNCYSCQKGQKWCLWLMNTIQIYSLLCREGQRLCYVETRDIHIFAHNFLNIQLIFNLKKVLKS